MAEELLINTKIGGDNISKLASDVDKLGTEVSDTAKAYDKLEDSTDKLSKTSTKAGSEIAKIRKAIKEAKDEMLKAEEGTEEYNRALAKAGQLQFKLKDLNDKARLSVQDFGQTSKNVAGAVAGMGSAFQVAQGAMALFGLENDAALQTIVKLQATMSVVSGIGQFADSLDSMKDLWIGLKSGARASSGAVTELSKVSKDAAHSMGDLGKESAVIGSNLGGGAAMIGAASMKSSAAIEAAAAAAKSTLANTEAKFKNLGPLTAQQTALLDKHKANVKLTEEQYNNLGKGGQGAMTGIGSSILKTLGPMLLITAAIAGVIYGITKLIEWMNKIPKNLEIKIAINEDALKQTQKVRESIKEIRNEQSMANEARKRGDKETTELIQKNIGKILDTIRDGASKEYNLAKDKDKWLNNFAIVENERQRKLAFNKVLFAKQAESEIALMTAKGQLEMVVADKGFKSVKEREDYIKAVAAEYQKSIDNAIYISLSTGLDKKAFEAFSKLSTARKDIKVMNSITPYKVFEPIKETKASGGSSGGTSTSITSKVGDYKAPLSELDAYNKTFDAIESEYISIYTGISEEQAAIDRITLSENKQFLISSKKQKLLYSQEIIKGKRNDLEAERFLTEESLDILEWDREFRMTNNTLTLENLRSSFINQTALISDKESVINSINKSIYDNEDKISKLTIKLNKEKVNSKKQLIQNEIDGYKLKNNALKESATQELKTLQTLKREADQLLKDKSKVEADLSKAVAEGANIDTLKTKLDDLNSQIIDNAATAAQITRDLWMAAFDEIAGGIEQIGKTLSSLSNINDLMMTTIDNKTNHEKNSLELSDDYQKASSEKQQQMMYDLDKKNYDSKVKLFETKKMYDIGVVAIEAISSEMSAVKNLIGNGGAINPIAWIAFAAETALITSTAAASISEIASRSLDAPIPPNGGGAGGAAVAVGAGGANVALNPSKTTLTSKEENLNMMSKSGQSQSQTVVKVSDINKVQNTVTVRETNSSY